MGNYFNELRLKIIRANNLLQFTIKALTYTYVPAALAHCTQSASIVWNRKTQRSLVRGHGTSIDTRDHPDLTVSNSMEKCIGLKRVKSVFGLFKRIVSYVFG